MPRLKSKNDTGLPTRFDELVRLLPPRAIHDGVEYENTQDMIDRLTSIPKLTQGQAQYLDTLSILLEAFEDENHQIEADDVDAVDVLKVLMEEHGMNASALGTLLGDRALGTRVLRGERDLSKAHIRKLAQHFHVNPGVLF